MFVILLRFTADKGRAGAFLEAHKAWVDEGVRDGKFLLVGSLKPNLGGAIFVHGLSESEVRTRVDADPFVAHGVVSAEILEIGASKVDDRLRFLVA